MDFHEFLNLRVLLKTAKKQSLFKVRQKNNRHVTQQPTYIYDYCGYEHCHSGL